MIDIGGGSTMGRWNPEILETHIAPGISEFRDAVIPDLSGRFPQADFWVGNYFLNSVLRVGFRDRWRQIVNGFLRRASQGLSAYLDARRLTLEYLDGNSSLNPRIGRYYKTTAAWEGFAIDMTIAADLFKWLNNGAGAFTKNDGSKECRLYEIGNKVKHMPTCINSGQCTMNDTVPLWINSAGLNSFGITVTFDEAAKVLTDICTLADELQDPLAFIEKAKAHQDCDEPAE